MYGTVKVNIQVDKVWAIIPRDMDLARRRRLEISAAILQPGACIKAASSEIKTFLVAN
jgi:hypothetical protein